MLAEWALVPTSMPGLGPAWQSAASSWAHVTHQSRSDLIQLDVDLRLGMAGHIPLLHGTIADANAANERNRAAACRSSAGQPIPAADRAFWASRDEFNPHEAPDEPGLSDSQSGWQQRDTGELRMRPQLADCWLLLVAAASKTAAAVGGRPVCSLPLHVKGETYNGLPVDSIPFCQPETE